MSDPYVEGLGEYMEAVRNHPKLRDEDGLTYAQRITAIVQNGGKTQADREPGEEG